MKVFSLKNSLFSLALLTSFSFGQIFATEQVAKEENADQINSDTLIKVQPSLNRGVKTLYKITKKTVLPLSALYLFMRYLSPLSEKLAQEDKPSSPQTNNTSSSETNDATSSKPVTGTDNSTTPISDNNSSKSGDKKTPVQKTAEELLKLILGTFILDAYLKPEFKAAQEFIEYYVSKIEEKLNFA